MAEITNELIYEILKRIQQDIAAIRSDQREMRAELIAIRTHQLAMQQDIHNLYTAVAGWSQRVERIERRLDLVEPAQ